MVPLGAKILIVDDDLDTCLNFADLLTDLGYRVDTAQTYEQTLALLAKENYDIALLDYKLSDQMDGVSLYRKVREMNARTVGIIVTGFASEQTSAEALTVGIRDIVHKPVDFRKLHHLLLEAVATG